MGGFGPQSSLASRVRSASPSRRTLAIDMRHIASLLRDPNPGQSTISAAPGEASASPSVCSSPHNAWENGDSGAAPMRLNRSPAAGPRTAGLQNQFSAIADKVNVVISGLQRQCDQDRRRIAGLERKVEAKLEESSRESENRERWAEVQGSVSGLMEETQGLTRRVESLDERLWARTSGSELAKQKSRELEQQVQALEQQTRMSTAAFEEAQKRQATKLRRAEHTIEDLLKRLSKVEEDRLRPAQPGVDGFMQSRIATLEQHVQELFAESRSVQMQLDEGLQHLHDETRARDDGSPEGDTGIGDAIQSLERNHGALEKKVLGSVEDLQSSLATIRVKVDGHCQRVGTLAERLETAHVPALEAMRSEFLQTQSQHRCELDGEIMAVKKHTREHHESHDETVAELREELRQARAELAANTLQRHEVDYQHGSSTLLALGDRLTGHEQEIDEIRSYLAQLPQGQVPPLPQHGEAGGHSGEGGEYEHHAGGSGEMLEDIQRRLEWLEEQSASASATPETDAGHQRQLTQVQNSICDMREQVSRLSHRASSGETASSALQQQLQQLQGMIDGHQHKAAGASMGSAEVEAKVGAVSQQVADISARLLEVEGSLDFARELPATGSGTTTLGGEEASSQGKPYPGHVDLHEKLDKVAEQLEYVDDMQERLEELEKQFSKHSEDGQALQQRVGELEKQPAKHVGSPTTTEAPAAAMEEVRERLGELEGDIGSVRKALTRQETMSKELESGFKVELNSLKGIVDTVSSLSERVKAVEEAEEPPAIAEIRREVGLARQEAKASAGGASQSPSHAGSKDIAEVRDKAEAAAAAASKASENASSLHARIDGVEERLKTSLAPLASLPDHQAALESLSKKVSSAKALDTHGALDKLLAKLEGESAEAKECGQKVQALGDKMSAMEREANELRQAHTRHTGDLTTHGKHVAELKQSFEEVDAKMAKRVSEDEGAREEVQSRVKQLTAKVTKDLSDLADHQTELVSMRTTLEGLAGKDSSAAVEAVRAQVDSAMKRLSALEAQQNKGSPSIGSAAPAGLEQVKRDAGLAKAAIEDFQKQLEAVQQRVKGAEEAAKGVKAEVEQLQPRKVGISAGSSVAPVGAVDLEAVNTRLDELSEQVEELQARAQGRPRPRVEDATKEGSLNFSLTGMEQTKESSLNFSLTEDTTSKHGQRAQTEDSLNFSLTGGSFSERGASDGLSAGRSAGAAAAAKGIGGSFDDVVDASSSGEGSSSLPLEDGPKAEAGTKESVRGKLGVGGDTKGGSPLSRLGNLPSLGAKRGADSSGDVLESLIKGDDFTGKSASASGVRPRPSPLAGIGASDESHTAGRGLASVAEEESASVSDLCEQSAESATKQGASKVPMKTVGLGTKVVASASPASSAASPHGALDASLASQSNPLDVSVSCNEISMGPDISVEDSLELEKCDHVEVVMPTIPAAKSAAASSSLKPVLGSLSAVKATTGSSGAAASAAPKAEAKAAATTVGLGAKTGVALASTANASKDDDDQDYGHESFEDDMSVAESIEESLDGTGSDAWGNSNE